MRAGTDVSPHGDTSAPAHRLDERDGARLGTLRSVFGLELDVRTFRQRLEAFAADRAEMHEDVLAPITRGDEPKALRIVEPLHGSGCHENTSSRQSRTGR